MPHSDKVRNYCTRAYVEPARKRQEKFIKIRSGDVHDALNYNNRLPLVCAALGTNIFEIENRIRRINIDGPSNGANTVFHFEILP